MGHQFSRAALAAALTAIAACGGSGDAAEPPPVLDNARDVVAAASGPADTTDPATEPATDSAAGPDELPPPDPSTFRGALRVVNLWLDPAGAPGELDVWVRRTFTEGPVQLASEVAFGAATPYLAAPPGSEVVAVAAGAGPDGSPLADLPLAGSGEQATTVVANRGRDRGVEALSVVERGGVRMVDPPADDRGVVVIAAPNLGAFADALVAGLGAASFAVGDGAGTCRPQRVEADGFPPASVGVADTVELEAAAGPTVISLHPEAVDGRCAAPSVLDLTVDVEAGSGTLVVVFTRDGSTLDAIAVPIVPGS